MSIVSKVKTIVANRSSNEIFKLNPSLLLLSHNLSNDLGIDSIKFIEIIAELEDEFEIEICYDEVEINIEVGDLIKLVENKIFEGEKHEI